MEEKVGDIQKVLGELLKKLREFLENLRVFFLIPHISSSAPSEIANNLMPKIRIELREEARKERRKSLSLQL